MQPEGTRCTGHEDETSRVHLTRGKLNEQTRKKQGGERFFFTGPERYEKATGTDINGTRGERGMIDTPARRDRRGRVEIGW